MKETREQVEDRARSIRDNPPEIIPEPTIKRREGARPLSAQRSNEREAAPTLTLRQRTPEERRARYDGARLALTMVLQRLPSVVAHPPAPNIAGEEVLSAVRAVEEAMRAGEAAEIEWDP